jgi:hypothetical protein
MKCPYFLWNPDVHYRVHKNPPLKAILGHTNVVHIPPSHSFFRPSNDFLSKIN